MLDFINSLEQKLKKPLPGYDAHVKFMHQARLETTIIPDNKTRNSAVLILFYPKENEIYFPLILRPAYDGTHSGQIALPGGKKELNDENLARTALRETEEEIGIKALDVKILGELTEIFIPVSNFKVKPYIGFIDYTPEFFPDPKEVEQVYEIKIKDFKIHHQHGNQLVKAGLKEIVVPGFQVYDQWLWGATALIVNELLTVLN